MNVENSSPRGFDWGCIWNPWQRTLLLFFVRLCPALGQTHLAEGGLMWSADASLAGNSLLGWQCLLLDYVSSCFDMAQLRIMCSSHSLFLPAVALFFSSKDFLADLQSLTLSEPETLQITHKVLPSQSASIADRYELFHLSNPQHTCSHSGWVSGDFRVLKSQCGVARHPGLWIRKCREALFACWQRVSRPVFAYIHSSQLGVSKNVVVLH